MEGRIERLVAEVGAGGVGEIGGNAFACECLEHGRQRQRREIGDGTARLTRLAARLVACVVGAFVVHHVHGDALEREARAPGGQAQVQHRERIVLAEEARSGSPRLDVMHGENGGPHGQATDDAAVHRLGDFLRGIGGMPAEGLESGDEYHGSSRFSRSTICLAVS